MYGCDKYGYSDDHSLPQPKDCTHPKEMVTGAALFFLFFFVLGALVIFNLFVGIVTTAMEDASYNQREEEERTRAVRAMAKTLSISRAMLDNYSIAFEMMDHDQDGIVSPSEVLVAVGLAGVTIDPTTMDIIEAKLRR